MSKMRDLREAAGLTQKQCADFTSISHQYWAFIENGDKIPGKEVALRIAAFLEVDVEELEFAELTPAVKVPTTTLTISFPDDSLAVIDRIRGSLSRQKWIRELVADNVSQYQLPLTDAASPSNDQ
jgi:transcriptional regulator with XRE-family HTH domain